jgi:subtilisin family serine protease
MEWDAVIGAVNYAIDFNISIFNMSLGHTSVPSTMLFAMLNYKGLIVCAAGNDGTNTDRTPHYPSSYPLKNIISVAASDQNDVLLYNEPACTLMTARLYPCYAKYFFLCTD